MDKKSSVISTTWEKSENPCFRFLTTFEMMTLYRVLS